MIVSSELLRAEVETARLRDELAAARGRARVAEAGLSFHLGAPLDSRWSTTPLGDPPPLGDPLDRWLADADDRADLAAARRRAEAAALEPRALRARRLPRVGVAARYDLVDDLPFGTEGDHHAVLAMASFDLFAGGRHRAAEAAARAEAEAAGLEVERFAEGIRLEVHEAYLAAQTARERLATADAGVAAARETERIVVERFRQGLVRTVDVLDATNALAAAESRRATARADAHLGSLRLALAVGVPPPQIPSTGPVGDPERDGGTR
jgi:outer membrane protein